VSTIVGKTSPRTSHCLTKPSNLGSALSNAKETTEGRGGEKKNIYRRKRKKGKGKNFQKIRTNLKNITQSPKTGKNKKPQLEEKAQRERKKGPDNLHMVTLNSFLLGGGGVGGMTFQSKKRFR